MTPTPELLEIAHMEAKAHDLDVGLVCAIVEQESAWYRFASRYEPLFMSKYVAVLYTSNQITATEAYARSFSWGLMQLMGQTARELGFPGKSLAELCDPQTGLEWGCKLFVRKLELAKGDIEKALLLWNGGDKKDYAQEVLSRVARYSG